MRRDSLDMYEKRPEAMTHYLNYYGWHFNKKMCEFAINNMYKGNQKIVPYTKQKMEDLFKQLNIQIKNNIMYDALYVINMLKADFLNSSIIDEKHLALGVKDYLDDEDGYESIAFSRFYIDTIKKGIPIEWEDMI